MVVMSRTPPLAPPEPAAAPSTGSGIRRVLDVIAVCIFVALAGSTVWFIHRYGVNAIYDDQWTDINVLRDAHMGTLSFATLWAQHNENRVFFPNLIVLLLGYTTHFNLVVEDYLSGLFAFLTAGFLIVAHKRRSPSIPLIAYCPVAIVLLMFVPLADVLFSYQMSWYLMLLGLAGAIFFLDGPILARPQLAAAIAFGVVGSFSSMEGLFIWPTGLVLLYLRRRPRGPFITWVVAACVTVVVYFADYNFSAAGGQKTYVLSHPLAALEYFISSIGNVIDQFYPNASPTVGSGTVFTLGFLVLAISLWALGRGFRPGRVGGGPIGVALIVFGLIFVSFITFGRSQLGLSSAGRYSIFTLMIWVGAYLALLEQPPEGARAMLSALSARIDDLTGLRTRGGATDGDGVRPPALAWPRVVSLLALAGLLALMAIQLQLGTSPALADASAWHNQELTIAEVTANIDSASDTLVTRYLGSYPASYMRQMARFAQAQHLSLFDTPLAAEDRRQGLNPDLLTVLLVPADGTIVSGVQVLDASAEVTKGVTAVQFRATGGNLHDAVIGVGRQTLVGWVDHWNTRTVPNGSYTLRSVLVHRAGATTSSDPVNVVVMNKPPT
jgi:hypothetical protein